MTGYRLLGLNSKEQQSQSFLRSKNARNGVGVQLEQLHYLLLLMQERKIFQMMMERKRGRHGLLQSPWHYVRPGI
ncbi:hypothetical protein V2J09_017895 [Rumex salicifolius]